MVADLWGEKDEGPDFRYHEKLIWELKVFFGFEGDMEDETRNIMKPFLTSSEVRGYILLILISFTTSNRMFSYKRIIKCLSNGTVTLQKLRI